MTLKNDGGRKQTKKMAKINKTKICPIEEIPKTHQEPTVNVDAADKKTSQLKYHAGVYLPLKIFPLIFFVVD